MRITTKTYWLRLPPKVANEAKSFAKARRQSRASFFADAVEHFIKFLREHGARP